VDISNITSGANSIDTLVQRFMVKEREPVTNLENEKSELQDRLNIFTDLKDKLKIIRDKAKDFTRVGSLNTLNTKTATLSDSSHFSITPSASAHIGSYAIRVDRIASMDTGVSRQLERDTVWDYDTGLQEFTIAVGDGEAQTISITIEDTDTHLDVMNKVADAVNAAGIEVTASVINDTSSTARLVIKSNETGSENYLNIAGVGGSNILSDLGYVKSNGTRLESSGTGGGFLVLDTADLDAKINLDGIDIIKGTNEIQDVIEGITIKLLKVHDADASPTTFTIDSDTSNAKTEIEDFIEKFNEAIKYLNEKTKIDTTTYERGALVGDIVFSGIKFSMRSIVSSAVTSIAPGGIQLLSQAGIELSREGTLSIADSSKFEDALETNFDDIVQIFSAEDGIANNLVDLLDNFITAGGSIDRRKQSINSQMSSIDTRIKNYEARLLIREQNLRQQYTELQKTLSLLNSQRATLQSYQSYNLQMYSSY